MVAPQEPSTRSLHTLHTLQMLWLLHSGEDMSVQIDLNLQVWVLICGDLWYRVKCRICRICHICHISLFDIVPKFFWYLLGFLPFDSFFALYSFLPFGSVRRMSFQVRDPPLPMHVLWRAPAHWELSSRSHSAEPVVRD